MYVLIAEPDPEACCEVEAPHTTSHCLYTLRTQLMNESMQVVWIQNPFTIVFLTKAGETTDRPEEKLSLLLCFLLSQHSIINGLWECLCIRVHIYVYKYQTHMCISTSLGVHVCV